MCPGSGQVQLRCCAQQINLAEMRGGVSLQLAPQAQAVALATEAIAEPLASARALARTVRHLDRSGALAQLPKMRSTG